MDINYNTLLFEQLKLKYPKSKGISEIFSESKKPIGVLIQDIPYSGMEIVSQGRIEFIFKEDIFIDAEALFTYMEPRVKYDKCDLYYKKNKFFIYLKREFSQTNKGRFEKAMWEFRVIEYFIKSIKLIVTEISGEK